MDFIYSPEELERQLGENLKQLRLQQNRDRESLCAQAGISVNALRHLENGQGVTLKTLIRVIKALNRQDWLLGIAPQVSINPLHMPKSLAVRQRASKKKNPHVKKK
jgi:transcriptional regulator with XRE-family HTH domain